MSSWRLDLEKRYAAEKSETLAQADGTMDGKAQGWVEGTVENAVDMAKGLYGLANNVLKAVGGDGVAQQTLKEGAGSAWEYVANPDNWPYLIGAMTPEQREQLAQAYELGDGNTVGKVMGEQVTNVLSALPSGGLAGIVKITKIADKFGDIKSTIGKIEKSVNGSEVDQLTKTGIKFSPDKLIATGKTPDGQIVFLETGKSTSGLTHILERHEADFINKGISVLDIPSVLIDALTKGALVGKSGAAPVYKVIYKGEEKYIAIGVGSNGYIVRANPVSEWKELR